MLVKDPIFFFFLTSVVKMMRFLQWCILYYAVENTIVVHKVHEDWLVYLLLLKKEHHRVSCGSFHDSWEFMYVNRRKTINLLMCSLPYPGDLCHRNKRMRLRSKCR